MVLPDLSTSTTQAAIVQSRLGMPKPLQSRILSSLALEATTVFRAMREDSSRAPVVGSGFAHLGVRVCGVNRTGDVRPDKNNRVLPGGGGMSVYLRAESMIGSLKPRSMGGEGRYPLWEIGLDRFPSTTKIGTVRDDHTTIEPASAMLIDDFQDALGSTRSDWVKYA